MALRIELIRRPLYTHQSPRLIQLQDNLSDGLGEIIQT